MDHLPSKLVSRMVLSYQAREEMQAWEGREKESQCEKDVILILAPTVGEKSYVANGKQGCTCGRGGCLRLWHK